MKKEEYSQKTITIYENYLKKLDECGINYKNVDDESELVDKIKNIEGKDGKKIKDSSIKGYLSSILWYYKNNKSNTNIFDKFRLEINKIKQKKIEDYDENKLNEKEKEVYLEWDQIVEVYKVLYENRSKNFTAFRDCVTIGLYVLFPPRRLLDYSEMIVKKESNNLIETENYYIIKYQMLIFNNFKTKDTCEKIFDAPDELRNLLDEYIDKYGLVDKKLLGFSSNDLSEKIKNIMKKYTQKPSSVNVFRHSYISYMQKNGFINSTKQKKDLASKMGHSHHTQQEIYAKY